MFYSSVMLLVLAAMWIAAVAFITVRSVKTVEWPAEKAVEAVLGVFLALLSVPLIAFAISELSI